MRWYDSLYHAARGFAIDGLLLKRCVAAFESILESQPAFTNHTRGKLGENSLSLIGKRSEL